MMALYEAVIGLEVHAQLLTQSKMFCSVEMNSRGEPNTHVGVVSAGLPGSLPVLNKKAVELAVRAGIACNCQIHLLSRFDRKNYFYPDLPKGYQISQFEHPICGEGYLDIVSDEKTGKRRRVRIQRIHMEEDAGQLMHVASSTLVNLNRAGTPLIEIVGHPDLRTPFEAKSYLKLLHSLLVYAGVTDGDLEEGNFRCDANVSIRKVGETRLGTRTEIKNVNSFRFVEQALEYEIARQIAVVEAGGKIVQETRGWDSAGAKTFTMRTKEDADDYRYFPDPDLPPLKLEASWVEELRSTMPELPEERALKLQTEWGLNEDETQLLIQQRDWLLFCQDLVSRGIEPKRAVSFVLTDLVGELKHLGRSFQDSPLSAAQIAALLQKLQAGILSRRQLKEILIWWMQNPSADLDNKIQSEAWIQVDDPVSLERWVMDVITAYPEQVQDYLGGKEKILPFLMGQVMKLSKGKAHPQRVSEMLLKKLKG
jgi:aspartyl-tRNA(Asn)/glutamyl-tRNA(Gln) amidotransferase subunit B